jgi:hypothetical protein
MVAGVQGFRSSALTLNTELLKPELLNAPRPGVQMNSDTEL